MSILETKGLKKYYGSEPSVVKALDGVDMRVEQGSFTAVAGRELQAMNDDELTIFRRRQIGMEKKLRSMPNQPGCAGTS